MPICIIILIKQLLLFVTCSRIHFSQTYTIQASVKNRRGDIRGAESFGTKALYCNLAVIVYYGIAATLCIVTGIVLLSLYFVHGTDFLKQT